jgi:hypothetical protein
VNDDPTNPDPNVRLDYGGWISGPCIEPDAEPIPLMDTSMTGDLLREMYPAWTIERNPLGVWTAEQTAGTEIRYLVARQAWELAAKIKAAEAAGS